MIRRASWAPSAALPVIPAVNGPAQRRENASLNKGGAKPRVLKGVG